jgi:glutamate-1-semialdehyde 2,1-aminomutase
LHGHARLSQRFAKLVPFYEHGEERFFSSDDAPADVAAQRRSGFARLSRLLQARAPETIRRSDALESDVSDLHFTTTYRVPFPYAGYVRKHLKVGALAQET